MAVTIIADATKLAKAIVKHITARGTLVTELHSLALSCIFNATVSGNPTLMNQLCDGADYAKASLVKWAVENKFFVHIAKTDKKPAHLTVNKATRAKYADEKGQLHDEPAFLAMLSELTSYHEFDPPKEYKPFETIKELKKLSARAKKAMNDEKRAGLKHDFTGITDIDALIAKLAQSQPVNNLPV